MYWVLYGVIVLIVLVVLVVLIKRPEPKDNPQSNNIKLPYKKRDDFLSASELSFYRTLNTYIENKAVICPKVAIREIVFVGKGVGKDHMKFFNWIAKKHIDFALCNVNTMQVVCGVELDDKSHQREDRQKRDAFVDRVFETAKIPLFHIPLKSAYSVSDLSDIIYNVMVQESPAVNILKTNAVEKKINKLDTEPLCPKCGISMIKRKATHGDNAGKEFYGCTNYPNCKEVKQI